MALRISVDFNTMMMDAKERVLINASSHKDVVGLLQPGLLVVLYDETLEVEALVEFDEKDGRWWAKPAWPTSRRLPYPYQSMAG